LAYKKILVCLDGSALAEAALPHAQILGADEEAEIVLLRVSANPAAELQSVRSKLQKAGFRASFLICQGAIAETILSVV
jgi:nucleotide-binding universal stress UspA family protein